MLDVMRLHDQLRENLLNPKLGNWHVSSWMMGESVPLEKNHVRLHPELKDKYAYWLKVSTGRNGVPLAEYYFQKRNAEENCERKQCSEIQ